MSGLLYYEWDFYSTSRLRFVDPSFSRSKSAIVAGVFDPSFSSAMSGLLYYEWDFYSTSRLRFVDPSFSRSKSAIVAGVFDPSFKFLL